MIFDRFVIFLDNTKYNNYGYLATTIELSIEGHHVLLLNEDIFLFHFNNIFSVYDVCTYKTLCTA